MLIVTMTNNNITNTCGLKLYNYIFLKLTKNYFTPFWYYPEFRKTNFYFRRCMKNIFSGFIKYYENGADIIEKAHIINNKSDVNTLIGETVRDVFSLKLLTLMDKYKIKLPARIDLKPTLKIIDQTLNNISIKDNWFEDFTTTIDQLSDTKYSGILKYNPKFAETLLFSSSVFSGVMRILSYNYKILKIGDSIIPYSLSFKRSVKGGISSIKKLPHNIMIATQNCCDDFTIEPIFTADDLTIIIFRNTVEIIKKGNLFKVFLVKYNINENKITGKKLLVSYISKL